MKEITLKVKDVTEVKFHLPDGNVISVYLHEDCLDGKYFTVLKVCGEKEISISPVACGVNAIIIR